MEQKYYEFALPPNQLDPIPSYRRSPVSRLSHARYDYEDGCRPGIESGQALRRHDAQVVSQNLKIFDYPKPNLKPIWDS